MLRRAEWKHVLRGRYLTIMAVLGLCVSGWAQPTPTPTPCYTLEFLGDVDITGDLILRINEGDTVSLKAPASVTTSRTATFPDADGEVTLLGQEIDISDDTNLAGTVNEIDLTN